MIEKRLNKSARWTCLTQPFARQPVRQAVTLVTGRVVKGRKGPRVLVDFGHGEKLWVPIGALIEGE